MRNPWIVIPARGGSVGIPRKNLWLLNSKPMVWHALSAALEVTLNTVLITDDDEIAEIGEALGAKIILEPEPATGKRTLDEVIFSYLPELKALGAEAPDKLITLQPTSPLITPETLHRALVRLDAGSVISVSDDRHLRWRKENKGYVPDYEQRLNRQLLPESWRETGAIIGCFIKDLETTKTRINQPVNLLELDDEEAIDIDNFSDLAVAEHYFSKKRIFFVTDSSELLGMGHVYRVLALAQELARHELKIFLSPDKPLGEKFFSQYGFDYQTADDKQLMIAIEQARPELIFFDRLDTDKETISEIRRISKDTKIISFEDQGSGAQLVDLLISDIYENQNVGSDKQLTGIENSILAPSFETLNRQREVKNSVDEIVVLFGGTDPSGLAPKALKAIESLGFEGKVKLIRGLGAKDITQQFGLNLEVLSNVKNMPKALSTADVAISSAGRTITELASLGIPTVCMAQNDKELTHSHTTPENGVLMLGLGSETNVEDLARAIQGLINDFDRRKQLSDNAKTATMNRTNRALVAKIMSLVFRNRSN